MFWFKTREDRKEFVSEVDKIFGPCHSALDWHHVMFSRDEPNNEAPLRLKFREAYLPKAQEFVDTNPGMTILTDNYLRATGNIKQLLDLRKVLDEYFLMELDN